MGKCQTCIHYRPVAQRSAPLASECESNERSVYEALLKIREEERKLELSELTQKKELMLRDRQVWLQRPLMTDYCAVHESQNVFYVRDLKNAGERCRDFVAGTRPEQTCGTCLHRSPSFGRERDLGIAQVFMVAIARMPMFQGANQEKLKQHQNACAQAMANQLTQAFYSEGFLPQRPEYLNVCKEFSTHGEAYAVCAIVNPQRTCPRWQATARGTGSDQRLELVDGQLDWAQAGGVELLLESSNLRMRYPDPDLGPAKQASFDLRRASNDGASQLAMPDGARLPLIVRFHNCVAYIRIGPPPKSIEYPVLLPTDAAPRSFRARPDKYYKHPNEKLKFGVRVAGSSLMIYNGYGMSTSFDLSRIPRNTWVTPHEKGLNFPLRVRLGWVEHMVKAFVPEVEWLD